MKTSGKLLTVLLVAGGLALVSGAAFYALPSGNISAFGLTGLFATGSDFGISITETNNVSLSETFETRTGTVKTKNSNDVGVTYTSAKSVANGVAVLANGGSIKNTTQVAGIKEITVVFEGTLKVRFSSDTQEYGELQALTSGSKLVLEKTFDYFEIVSEDETTITSIEIKHSCSSRFSLDGAKILEAEEHAVNKNRIITDASAHGGKYVGDINDCGEGIYFRYYAFEAGNRDVTIAYSTASVGSFHTLFANGNDYKVNYTVNTGWFGDSKTTADVVISDVSFVQGWNELYLVKDGKSNDNPAWGGYAQVDYIKIEGSGRMIDSTDYDMSSNLFNLEAEMARWHWNNENQKPTNWGSPFSMGYGLGEMNQDGDGAEFRINIAQTGKYAIRPVLGGNKSLKVSVDGGTSKVYEFGEFTQWNNPVVSGDSICVLELSEGVHSLDFTRNDNWFTFDKLVIERVE